MNKEIKRRTNVVGTFPNTEALLRLTGHVLIEQHDEWNAVGRRYFSENSMKVINPGIEGVVLAGLEAAQTTGTDSRNSEVKFHHSTGRSPREQHSSVHFRVVLAHA